jgi:hypothetical protein
VTEQYRQECEAREWLARYNKKKQLGKGKASIWWEGIIANITRIRGIQAANQLRQQMRKQNETSSKN